ncbi:cytochrome c oxidase subunit 3 family protein [Ramlibacter sp. G-1-2-2]|uniref:Cytochrome c oxidase subunit 3 family protein n=1 Tax=Ramlibacter agri TaxID=2728837 RepID=A0A848H429_9BURK|nr:cytochrome c oxidase subunit 3 [Ramlibacter agri]NML43970.1 cytochrome c oxidase subunit 3 family protein [Ramlibacter agri]
MSAVTMSEQGEAPRLGMWVFLASEFLFFGGLLLAYVYARSHWPEGFAQAGSHTHVVLGTLNTALLLTSSAVIAVAVACAEDYRRWSRRLLWVTFVLGLAFLAVKGLEYWKEWGEHLVPGPDFALHAPGAELFFLLYFLLTGVHTVHMLAGLVVVGTLAGRGAREATHVEVGALYWHFVDIVWIFLYPLLYLVGRAS